MHRFRLGTASQRQWPEGRGEHDQQQKSGGPAKTKHRIEDSSWLRLAASSQFSVTQFRNPALTKNGELKKENQELRINSCCTISTCTI
jgi:hypothetical protein